MKPVRSIQIGLFGLGTVGSGVVKILQSQSKALEVRMGVRIVLKKICVRSLSKKRPVRVPRGILTTRPSEILNDPDIDIVVEVMGGIHPAKEIIARAFAAGKHVVTANKALLAEEGDFIFGEARRLSRMFGVEASVCGGIPIIKSVKEGLASNEISHILGIMNGTCNYILTRISQEGADFRSVLKDAQKKGYAEQDPSLDIDGVDTAHKLAVLSRISFGVSVPMRSIALQGIRGISYSDIAYAKELGYVVKLLAVAKKEKRGLELRVSPTLLPLAHPLANVSGVYNGVFLHADQAGDQLFYGRGAGMMPTASAVMSDILDISQILRNGGGEWAGFSDARGGRLRVLPAGESVSKYYLRFQVADKSGVLGRIAMTLGKHGISILSVHQKESHESKSVPVVILTYEAKEKNLKAALRVIDAQKETSQKTVVMRVEA
ncbi:MAG TPA: homoserine dehydrogenase [Candidatus Omnitrophota bacterium]|nr:homoserine dehydrogenase [Candidatus Omnitrophota bacterium]